MRRVRVCSSIAVLLATVMSVPAAPDQSFQQSYGKLPLAFEENRGQAPSGVTYLSHTRSGLVTLRPGGIQLEPKAGKVIGMRFAGAPAVSRLTGEQKLLGITSYLVGRKSDWIRGVPNFAAVRYASVYPGIDTVFHGNDRDLEYDFVLRPGADPDQIRIAFDGVNRINIDPQGNLELTTVHGIMKQRKPKIWQTGPRGRREVAGRYVVSGAAEARFELDAFDRRETLVIDPVIEYSSYFGSERDDRVQAIATDSTGAAYIAGSTATAARSWGFVSKLDPSGTAVIYTVFFGSGLCDAAGRGIGVRDIEVEIKPPDGSPGNPRSDH